jgi:hypothetical protein
MVPVYLGLRLRQTIGISSVPASTRDPLASLPNSGQATRKRHTRKLSYTKAAQEGLRMVIFCDTYPEVRVSKKNFVNKQRAIDGRVDGLPDEGFTHKLIDIYRPKMATAVVFQEEETPNWLGSNISSLKAWDYSRLKMFSLEAVPT